MLVGVYIGYVILSYIIKVTLCLEAISIYVCEVSNDIQYFHKYVFLYKLE